jgi:ribosomal protein S18 acetylase RimI-like enzyme
MITYRGREFCFMKAADNKNRSITRRPVTAEDDPFLFQVYASTREEELAGWDDLQKGIFLQLQYKLQKADYEKKFPDASHNIILLDGVAIGRLYVNRTNPDEIRGVDIAILPEYRSSGVGFQLIRELLDEATAANKPFRISVTKFNRAIRLYERMGFVKTGETPPTHIAMEWRSSG